MMYHIVEFKNENRFEVAIVPQNWLKDETTVYWPPYKTSLRINNAARKMEPPSFETWSLEKITRMLYSDEDFDKVRLKLKQAEETSDLQTCDEEEQKKRKRKPAKKIYESSEDASSEGEDEDSDEETECRPSQTKRPVPDTSSHPIQTFSSPPRLPTSAFQGMSSSSGQRPVTPSPAEEPSQRQYIGQNAVTQILTVLETMREENKEMKRMLQRLLARSASDDQPVQLPEKITLPIQTFEQMDELEEHLSDEATMASVVRFLSMFGGANVRESVERIMKEAMSNQLARGYNLKGYKKKKKFEGLQLLNVLYRCVQRNGSTRNATRKDVETEVAKWLTGARDREGGRKKRNKTPQSQPEAQAAENAESD